MILPLFPLNTVLFPGALLPLKVFETRYMDMVRRCLKDNTSFGVCLIREGEETDAGALPETIGCMAEIVDWEMPQLGILYLRALGTRRFEVLARRSQANGLLVGEVRLLPDVPTRRLPEAYGDVADILERLIQDLGGAQHFAEPFLFDDAAWVSYRMAEILPFDPDEKQRLLETEDTEVRLAAAQDFVMRYSLGDRRGV